MAKYKCIQWHKDLTVGATYTELMPTPNMYNACVTNDEGKPMYVPRKQFFQTIGEENDQSN